MNIKENKIIIVLVAYLVVAFSSFIVVAGILINTLAQIIQAAPN